MPSLESLDTTSVGRIRPRSITSVRSSLAELTCSTEPSKYQTRPWLAVSRLKNSSADPLPRSPRSLPLTSSLTLTGTLILRPNSSRASLRSCSMTTYLYWPGGHFGSAAPATCGTPMRIAAAVRTAETIFMGMVRLPIAALGGLRRDERNCARSENCEYYVPRRNRRYQSPVFVLCATRPRNANRREPRPGSRPTRRPQAG